MTTSPTHILCPIDLSTTSARALAHALALARWHGARVTVLHVHQMLVLPLETVGSYAGPTMPTVLSEAERARLDAAVTDFVAPHTVQDVPVQTVLVEDINVPAAIVSHADMVRADLVVIGTEGRSGFQRLMLGSVAERVLRRATCPVLTVPPHAAPAPPSPDLFRSVLCPIDFSASSTAALQWAVSWGAKAGARVTALHVVEMPPEAADPPLVDYTALRDRWIRDARQSMDRTIPGTMRALDRFEQHVTVGRPASEILRLAEARSTDLIVMGVRGRGAVDLAFFGSTTHQVVRRAACPVLAVHPE
jgi:nucleotide-binding universal stress UspA family protein